MSDATTTETLDIDASPETPKAKKAAKKTPLFAVLFEGGDTNDDGTADVRVRAHVAGRVLLDFRNVYRGDDVRKQGFTYTSIGRP